MRPERRVQNVRLSCEILNEISKGLNDQAAHWSVGGGINIRLIMWIVDHAIQQGELPEHSTPTWCWHNPAMGVVEVLIYSSEFPLVEAGAYPPLTGILLNRDRLARAIEDDRLHEVDPNPKDELAGPQDGGAQ